MISVLRFELFPLFALVLGSIVLKQVVPERRWLPTTLSTLAQISSNQGALQRWNCKRNRNEILKRHKELIFEHLVTNQYWSYFYSFGTLSERKTLLSLCSAFAPSNFLHFHKQITNCNCNLVNSIFNLLLLRCIDALQPSNDFTI